MCTCIYPFKTCVRTIQNLPVAFQIKYRLHNNFLYKHTQTFAQHLHGDYEQMKMIYVPIEEDVCQ